MKKVLRIKTYSGEIITEGVSEKYNKLSGRALISKILTEEVKPTCDPLGKYNKLIIAPGYLAGTTVTCVNRISIGAKSPLTGGIKESNAGGNTAYKLGKLNIKAIILENIPDNNKTKILYISKDKSELIEYPEIKNVGIYKSAEIIKEKYGKDVGIMLIGPVGEKMYLNSGISNTDNEGNPSRFSARGGLGAVMGSKGIKAIVIDDKGTSTPEISDESSFNDIKKEVTNIVLNNEAIANSYTKYGTSNLIDLINEMGALPTHNFSKGRFKKANNISGQKLYDLIEERQGEGKHSHACMPGCLIKCSNVFADNNGKTIVSPLEYETIGLLGSNCGIGSLDTIGKLNYKCNDLGLDTIETGGTIGVLMEAGVIEFGDEQGALNLLEEVRNDSYLGKIVASGTGNAAKVMGVRRAPTAKNQSIASYDPRAIKGLGVTYASSPMGADHTAGQTLRADIDHTKPEGQVEASKNAQINNAIHDSIGTCYFVGGAIQGKIELLAELISAMTGKDFTIDTLKEIAKGTILREKEFNKNAGLTEAHDRLAEFFYEEENPDVSTVFDVKDEDIKKVHDF
ncbi:MAG: aldehyde ferredoxin oxidoreductase C-terminal domain-containing protein [Halanaerobiales bacterium]|nr:aldehyde ferredoxin oxidoreductase C-terminal domain-containing protein [Halanaerobiales bacterium]